MNTSSNHWRSIVGCVFALFMSGVTHGQAEIKVVSPSEFEDMDGNGQSPAGPAVRSQFLYPASAFDSVPESHRLITAFAWRPDVANQVDTVSGPITVRLSTTTADSLTATFADNLGDDETLVFEGDVTWQTDNDTDARPRDFDYVVTFDDPFEYSGGNVVLDFLASRAFSNSSNWLLDIHRSGNGPPVTGAVGYPNDQSALLMAQNIYPAQFTFIPRLSGDFGKNGVLDADDINLLVAEINSDTPKLEFDLNGDQLVTGQDLQVWIKDLKNTWVGDANLDGVFSSEDMVAVFQAGKYELDMDAGWAEGDWTGDRRFSSEDMVAAFQDGGYEVGPRAVSAVPEPTCAFLLGIGLISLCRFRKSRQMQP